MMKNVKMLFVSALAGSLMIVSCKKGDVGPAGATGPQGTAGTDSIYYSGPITLAMNPFTDVVNDWSGYLDSIAAPVLTQSVVDQDIILGYLYVPYGSGTDSAWVSIENASNQEAEMFPKVGKITIESWWTDYQTYSGNNGDLTGFKFKFFVIPPSLLTGTTQLTTVEPDALKHMSYDKAMTVLGIHPTTAGNIVTKK